MLELVDILDDDDLYRRLAPEHVLPGGIVSSAAYKRNGKPDPEISVDLARLTTPQESAARGRRSDSGLGSLVARYPRSLPLIVRHSPSRNNPSHSLIEGNHDRLNCRLLAENTTIIPISKSPTSCPPPKRQP